MVDKYYTFSNLELKNRGLNKLASIKADNQIITIPRWP